MKTIHGTISGNGSILGGTGGFDVNRVNTGIYDIHFHPHFEKSPTIVSTQYYDNGDTGGNTLDNSVIVKIEPSFVRIKTGDSAGNVSNRSFTFIAIGL